MPKPVIAVSPPRWFEIRQDLNNARHNGTLTRELLSYAIMAQTAIDGRPESAGASWITSSLVHEQIGFTQIAALIGPDFEGFYRDHLESRGFADSTLVRDFLSLIPLERRADYVRNVYLRHGCEGHWDSILLSGITREQIADIILAKLEAETEIDGFSNFIERFIQESRHTRRVDNEVRYACRTSWTFFTSTLLKRALIVCAKSLPQIVIREISGIREALDDKHFIEVMVEAASSLYELHRSSGIHLVMDYAKVLDLPLAAKLVLVRRTNDPDQFDGQFVQVAVSALLELDASGLDQALFQELLPRFQNMDAVTLYRNADAAIMMDPEFLDLPIARQLESLFKGYLEKDGYCVGTVSDERWNDTRGQPVIDKRVVPPGVSGMWLIQDRMQRKYMATAGDRVIVRLPKAEDKHFYQRGAIKYYRRYFIPVNPDQEWE